MGAARNLLNDWYEGKDLDDLDDFEPISPSTPSREAAPEFVIRRSNHKRIDKARAVRRESKERLLEADKGERASAS